MVVNTNVLALNSHRAMKNVGNAQAAASQKLSTGMKINSAADDAAGLAISEKMRGQIRGLDMASKNSQDAISLVQTAEGGLQEIGEMAQRIRELVVQAANDTNDQATGDRTKIQGEIANLIEDIDAMSTRVEFNNKKLLDGSLSLPADALKVQVGANAGQQLSFNINSMDSTALGINGIDVDIVSGSLIGDMISIINIAVNRVGDQRASLGAIENRLNHTIKNLDISSENLSASESRIRDTDMAKEMMNLTKANVLQQAAQSMLSQANQAPQGLTQLLR